MAETSKLAGSGIDEAACAAHVAAIEAKATHIETPCGDGTLAWRVWGEGEPLVLIHGSQGDWTHLIRNIEVLARHYRVIVLDMPGHGDSALPPDRSHAGMTPFTGQGLRQLLREGERANLVGFSYGGVHGTWLAAAFPELVRRIVLIGVGGLDTPVGPIELTQVRTHTGKARSQAHRSNLLGLMVHNPESADDLAIWLSEMTYLKSRFRQRDYEVMPDFVMQALPRVRAQVDAIWGAFDRAHPDPASQLAALRKGVPDAEMRVIPDAGHWVPYEQAERFNAELLDLLAASLRVPG
jgi:pimeloyl-ACP methyl ester carboxylesterase